jgi:hypothetical protein
MNDCDTKQDHPGPEWVAHTTDHPFRGGWFHPVLNQYAATVEQCRAISAAALAWESTKADRGLKELIAKLEKIEKALPVLRLLKELAQ